MARRKWKDPTFDPNAGRYVRRYETDFPAPNPPGWRFPWSIATVAFGMVFIFCVVVWIVEQVGW